MASKVSNTEWGLVIGAAVTLDAVQFALDFLIIGPLLNWMIDTSVGFMLPLYLKLRGIKMSGKKVGSIIGTFIFELIPGIDALPLWTADIVVIMLIDKAEQRAEKIKREESKSKFKVIRGGEGNSADSRVDNSELDIAA